MITRIPTLYRHLFRRDVDLDVPADVATQIRFPLATELAYVEAFGRNYQGVPSEVVEHEDGSTTIEERQEATEDHNAPEGFTPNEGG